MLQEQGIHARVIAVDLKEYGEALLRKKGRWNKLLDWMGLSEQVALPERVKKVIFFNVTPKMIHRYDFSKLPKEKLVLFAWEPRTVIGKMYHPELLKHFSKVYTFDDDLIDESTFFKFYYPVLSPMEQHLPSFQEKKFCTLIASDLHSRDEHELYTERVKTILFFEEKKEKGFEFYGRRWDRERFSSYRGEIENKRDVLKNYRFCICYENTQGVKGYITEKIFDCFSAGVVPVYWGASNVDNYIPKGCFIDRRDFDGLEELYSFLKHMSKKEYHEYLERIRLFLSSERAQLFSWESFKTAFCESVIN
jgi:hypothetical protein